MAVGMEKPHLVKMVGYHWVNSLNLTAFGEGQRSASTKHKVSEVYIGY